MGYGTSVEQNGIKALGFGEQWIGVQKNWVPTAGVLRMLTLKLAWALHHSLLYIPITYPIQAMQHQFSVISNEQRTGL